MGNYISQEQLRSTAEAAKRYTSGLVTELGQTTAEAIEELAGLAGGNTWYGTCTTSGDDNTKIIKCDGFTLKDGAEITINFSYTDTIGATMLNVNNTGIKIVMYRNAITAAGMLHAGGLYRFRYDGQYWRVVGDLASGRGEMTVTLTVSGWGKEQTQRVNAVGVTTSSLVFVSPTPDSWADYGAAGIRCTKQESSYLTFQAETVPNTSITVNVVVFT